MTINLITKLLYYSNLVYKISPEQYSMFMVFI